MKNILSSSDEVVRRGQELYNRSIRSRVEPEHTGKYIVIDIGSGEYEIDIDHAEASNRAAAKHPGGSLFATRIGFRTGGRIGAKAVRA